MNGLDLALIPMMSGGGNLSGMAAYPRDLEHTSMDGAALRGEFKDFLKNHTTSDGSVTIKTVTIKTLLSKLSTGLKELISRSEIDPNLLSEAEREFLAWLIEEMDGFSIEGGGVSHAAVLDDLALPQWDDVGDGADGHSEKKSDGVISTVNLLTRDRTPINEDHFQVPFKEGAKRNAAGISDQANGQWQTTLSGTHRDPDDHGAEGAPYPLRAVKGQGIDTSGHFAGAPERWKHEPAQDLTNVKDLISRLFRQIIGKDSQDFQLEGMDFQGLKDVLHALSMLDSNKDATDASKQPGATKIYPTFSHPRGLQHSQEENSALVFSQKMGGAILKVPDVGTDVFSSETKAFLKGSEKNEIDPVNTLKQAGTNKGQGIDTSGHFNIGSKASFSSTPPEETQLNILDVDLLEVERDGSVSPSKFTISTSDTGNKAEVDRLGFNTSHAGGPERQEHEPAQDLTNIKDLISRLFRQVIGKDSQDFQLEGMDFQGLKDVLHALSMLDSNKDTTDVLKQPGSTKTDPTFSHPRGLQNLQLEKQNKGGEEFPSQNHGHQQHAKRDGETGSIMTTDITKVKIIRPENEIHGSKIEVDDFWGIFSQDTQGIKRRPVSIHNNPMQVMTPHIPKEAEEGILNFVAKNVTNALKSGEHMVKMRLHPPELGMIRVELRVDATDNVVKAMFLADVKDIRGLLEQNHHLLRETLMQHGYRLHDFSVQSLTPDANLDSGLDWFGSAGNGHYKGTNARGDAPWRQGHVWMSRDEDRQDDLISTSQASITNAGLSIRV